MQTWLCCLFCIFWLIPSGGLTVFFALLLKGYGFDSKTTLLISMPSGVTQIVTNLFFPYLARRLQNRMLAASLAVLLSIFSIALMTGLASQGPTAHRIGQLVAYYIILGNSPSPLILILSLVSTNVAGYTKKTTVNSLVLISYCGGFLIGPQTFRDPPYYTKAKYTILGVYLASLLCLFGLWWINWRENRRRDQVAADLPPQPAGQEFLDLTDKENKYFRYAI
jgi:ACS family allantoate permease-like MFS transporter